MRIRTARNRADVLAGKRDWFRFEAKAGADETAVYIYDEISFFGISAQEFVGELTGVSSKVINLHVNSPGGDVFDGIAIYNALRQHSATVNVVVDGIAASIASVIAMAGDSITMSKGAMFMIHEPFALVIGDSADMRKQADALDLMGDQIAAFYAERAGGNAAYWRDLMRAETWYGDQAAVDAGLADTVATLQAAKNIFDLSIFRNGPRAESAPVPPAPTEPARPARDWRIDARHKVAAAELEVA
jgi:ATP-dependent protease ClpP protease subunit